MLKLAQPVLTGLSLRSVKLIFLGHLARRLRCCLLPTGLFDLDIAKLGVSWLGLPGLCILGCNFLRRVGSADEHKLLAEALDFNLRDLELALQVHDF